MSDPTASEDVRQIQTPAASLRQLTMLLEDAILQAVHNPLLLADSWLLEEISAQCADLAAGQQNLAAGQQNLAAGQQNLAAGQQNSAAGPPDQGGELDELVWQVRARAGRLQHLLDSASFFYAQCFSRSWLQQAEIGLSPHCLEYSVHGEWGKGRNTHRLSLAG